LPPKLTEDKELQVAILMSAEEEKRMVLELEATLTLSAVPPLMPAMAPSPPAPPIAAWPWPQGPFIDLSGEDEDEDGQA
jgi:hypothetical protein